jgi:hypothetical protein
MPEKRLGIDTGGKSIDEPLTILFWLEQERVRYPSGAETRLASIEASRERC